MKKPRKYNFSGANAYGTLNRHVKKAFYHPDYTVGPGVSPDPAPKRSRAIPPIRNWRLSSPHPAPKALHIDLSRSF
jgi:hypothetical protein